MTITYFIGQLSKQFFALKSMIEGTFIVPNDYNSFDIDIEKIITASNDPLKNLLINLLVADSSSETSNFYIFE